MEKSNMRKMLSSKKGMDPTDLTDIIIGALIFAGLFFVVFYFLSLTGASADSAVQSEFLHLNSYYTLKNFILTPVSADFSEGDAKKMAEQLNANKIRLIDMLQQINLKPENDEELIYKKVFEDHLQILAYSLPKGWKITIEKDGNKFEENNMGTELFPFGETAEILIPSKNPAKPVKVTLLQKNWWGIQMFV